VFDSSEAAPDAAREQRHHELRVLFASAEFEADDLIEELIAHHPAAKQLVVVSGDHRLHKAANRRGAHPMDSDSFWERLQKRTDAQTVLVGKPPPIPAPKTAVTSAATEAWLREFGEIDVAELAEEVRAEEAIHTENPWDRRVAELERMLDDPRQIEAWLTDVPAKPPHH
jgi:hypothetical protein